MTGKLRQTFSMNKIFFPALLVLLNFTLPAQHPDSLKPPIGFGRLINSLSGKVSERHYAKASRTFGKTYFIDNTLPLNNRRYQPVGFFYRNFEKYCNRRGIHYNKSELRRYRRKAFWSGMIFGMACMGFLPVAIDAEIYAGRSGNYNWPDMYFASPRAPVLWLLPVAEGIVATRFRSQAEKRLRDSLFYGQKNYR